MQKRFGGLLAIALGAVLIGNGLSGALAGTVGNTAPGACGAQRGDIGVNLVFGCPQGSITVTSTSATGITQPADGWALTLTSACLDSTNGLPVNRKLDVPDGTQGVLFEGLYLYPDNAADASKPCLYTLTQTPVTGVVATFDPTSPFAIPYVSNGESGYTQAVTLTHEAVTSTSTPPSSSAPASDTPIPSVSAEPSLTGSGPTTDFTDPADNSVSATAAAGGSSAAAPIAETGPSAPVSVSLWLGIGLLFLGLFLLFEGRIRTLGKHRD